MAWKYTETIALVVLCTISSFFMGVFWLKNNIKKHGNQSNHKDVKC